MSKKTTVNSIANDSVDSGSVESVSTIHGFRSRHEELSEAICRAETICEVAMCQDVSDHFTEIGLGYILQELVKIRDHADEFLQLAKAGVRGARCGVRGAVCGVHLARPPSHIARRS